jgi:hypothetical protein
MDVRDLPGVDIVHDVNAHPWPLPDECCTRIAASHLIEHIPPVAIGYEVHHWPDGHLKLAPYTWFPFVEFMDECWRIMKVGGELVMSAPYFTSQGFGQDPTHINPINEATFAYFDPMNHTQLWHIYKPKPWYYRYVSYDPVWSVEAILNKHSEDESLWEEEREKWGPATQE